MEHAITIGDLAIWIGSGLALVAVTAVIFGLIWLMNPFRTGH